ncbi:unnamed protein product [Rodentolepis nana]|uniref:SH3 domain-containing protein n=1 Tax=Rodentolepis nana TaxID=102285 RepID=A0A0R3T4Q4_RODNA|nr:unnamed protein product [Rodentolepis nana]
MELMYAYKESVEAANARLVELEKSRVEIICDTRLTVTKCDEVVSDSMAELISHLFVTRTKMLNQFNRLEAKADFNTNSFLSSFLTSTKTGFYVCVWVKENFKKTQILLLPFKRADVSYRMEGKIRGDAAFGKFVSRFAQLYSKDTTETTDGVFAEITPIDVYYDLNPDGTSAPLPLPPSPTPESGAG